MTTTDEARVTLARERVCTAAEFVDDRIIVELAKRLAARDAEVAELIELVRSVGAAKGLGWRDIAIAKLLRHVENKHGVTQ